MYDYCGTGINTLIPELSPLIAFFSVPPTTEEPITKSGPCSPGHYSATGIEPCKVCPIGQYAEGYSSKQCTKCPEGQVTDDVGSEKAGDCHKAEKQTGLTTGTLSVIGRCFSYLHLLVTYRIF